MTHARHGKIAFLSLALAFVVAMLSTTLPTPLYPLYQQQFGFSDLVITIIFATYAGGVIGALLITGSWSDQLGRRPLLGVGLVFSALSAGMFLWGGGLVVLIGARLLSGISAGIFTGTATIAVVELAPPRWTGRAGFVATAANMGGLGLGPLLAGVLSQYMPAPLQLVFIVDLLLVALAAVAVWYVPETAPRPCRPRLYMQSLKLPQTVRGVFVPAAIAGFAGFSVFGLFSAVAPALMGRILQVDNHALVGAVVCLLFISSTVGQMGQSRLPEQARLPLGCLLLIVGVVLIGLSIQWAVLAFLLAGAFVAGVGQGVAFRAGMGMVVAATPPARRGEVASTFFVVLYIAISMPLVGVGLAADTLGLRVAGLGFSGAVAGLALIALFMLVTRRRQASV